MKKIYVLKIEYYYFLFILGLPAVLQAYSDITH